MKEMNEMRKSLVELQMEGRVNQGSFESSITSINDLLKQRECLTERRMPERAAIITEMDRQADERWTRMSNTIYHRDTDDDKCTVNLMTTAQD